MFSFYVLAGAGMIQYINETLSELTVVPGQGNTAQLGVFDLTSLLLCVSPLLSSSDEAKLLLELSLPLVSSQIFFLIPLLVLPPMVAPCVGQWLGSRRRGRVVGVAGSAMVSQSRATSEEGKPSSCQLAAT